jgi:hypothetical protein
VNALRYSVLSAVDLKRGTGFDQEFSYLRLIRGIARSRSAGFGERDFQIARAEMANVRLAPNPPRYNRGSDHWRNTDPGELELRAAGHLADIAKIATE